MIVGSTMVIAPKFDPELLLQMVAQYKISHMMLVPTMLTALLDAQRKRPCDVRTLTRLMYGGSPIHEDQLATAVERFPVEFQQVYGQTETGVVVMMLGGEEHRLAANGSLPQLGRSCGKPILGYHIKIADNEGHEVPTDTVGEVLVRGASVTSGYWNRPEATEKAAIDGWWRTGDLGRRDADGYHYILDRTTDMIISGGENVYPVEVENVISGYPGLLDVAIVGVPDARWGEAVKAFVVVRPGHSVTPTEIIDFCRGRIAGFKIPKVVEIVDELPRNASGKILKRKLRIDAEHEKKGIPS